MQNQGVKAKVRSRPNFAKNGDMQLGVLGLTVQIVTISKSLF